MNRSAFYASARQRASGIFGTSIIDEPIASAAAGTITPTNGAGIYTNANTEIANGIVTALLLDETTNEWDIDIRARTSSGIVFTGGAQIALGGPADRIAFVANSGNLVAGAIINMRQSR